MIEVNRESLAWAAGLFEGEGCISIQKNGYGPRASLSMVDEDTVQKFSSVMGVGHVRIHAKAGKKSAYVWIASSFEETQHAICLLWKHLGERRRQRAAEVLRSAGLIRHNRLKTHCIRGHEYNKQNTWYVNLKSGYLHRVCKVFR